MTSFPGPGSTARRGERPLSFTVQATCGRARAARIETSHGAIETPIFMPVGTAGTVKAMTPAELEAIGAQILLGNTYHLYLRPGLEVVGACGGLHRMMAWPRPILTDSGGYQVFSLRAISQISDDGVAFQSHIDGSRHLITPERAVEIQAALGSDIAMAFDHCPPGDAPRELVVEAMERTTRWAARCLRTPRAPGQALFGIVQGGLDLALRRRHLADLSAEPFDGFALGGLSVGEAAAATHNMVDALAGEMPAAHPRYLMGVGTPTDILHAIDCGIDMFDCVLPTRNARNGQLFTSSGRLCISNAEHRLAPGPIDERCACETCRTYSRAYLRHLYMAKEILYSRLATLHNLHYYLDLVRGARAAIQEGRFPAYRQTILDGQGGW
jgi:queuine tRNA-ribosyltransferase